MTREEYESIVHEVREDFERRREDRHSLELQWRLNMNYLAGNQYAEISPRGDLEERGREYFWQEREVYNHVAPIIETRVSKLSRVQGKVRVRPVSEGAEDISSAKLVTRLLTSVEDECLLSERLAEGTLWSEVCGSVFYKVTWNPNLGKVIGKDKAGDRIKEGDVSITVVPPFEIYPDSLNSPDVKSCRSIIHAKAYHVDDVFEKWGVEVKGEEVNVFTMDTSEVLGGLGYTASITKKVAGKLKDHVIVLEKYVLPTKTKPFGELVITAGDKLLYLGDLPYCVGDDGARGFPFVRQTAIGQAGSFFGVSVIERVIPVQRAYNAVKNRKHEFMNRIAMGVLAVEDGSCDCDNLEEEGLAPGKILVYRQGSTPPRMLNDGQVPTDFLYEEKQLLEEFNMISGVSEFMQFSQTPTTSTSGAALNLLIRQDESRLSVSAESLRQSARDIGKMILRLMKQFVTTRRLKRIAGEGGDIETVSFTSSDLTSDDLVFETDNELLDSPAQRRQMVFELLRHGLLFDESGKLSQGMKSRVLDLLGFGAWDSAQDTATLNAKKAQKENRDMREGQEMEVSEFDDHEVHIEKHVAEIITNGESEIISSHLNQHRKFAEEKEVHDE